MKKRLIYLAACLLMGAMLLQTLPHSVQATVNPTAVGLTEFVLKAWRSGWGYVYGTYGQNITQALIDSKASQYPSVYAEIMSDGRTAYQHAQEWIGQRSADCVGLIKAYLWWQDDTAGPRYTSTQDKSANSLFAAATIQGTIETIPETQGLLVWRDGHIGIYIGNGEVIESRGVEYGVIKTRLTDRNWTNWCQLPYVGYSASGWTTVDSQTYYYRNGVYLTGLQNIDSRTYLFGPDGAQQTGFHLINSQPRYFQADGTPMAGWQTIDGARYYLDNTNAAASGWQPVDSQLRLFSPQGMLMTGWQEIENAVYYLDSNGIPMTGAQTIGSRQLAFGPDGRLLTGWQQMDSKTLYYALTGEKLQGRQLIAGQSYWFDPAGVRTSGWQTLDGYRYYFSQETGAALTGLQTIAGQAWLFQPDGILQATAGLFFGKDQVFLSNANGQPLTGGQTLNGFVALDPAPVPVRLELAADYTLKMQNQDRFALNQSVPTLIVASAGSSAVQMTPSAPQSGARWLSLDPAVAKVSAEGLVTAVGAGRTLVLLLTETGEYACARVTVLPAPASPASAGTMIRLEPGLSADLNSAGLPADLLGACVLTSSDPGVVTVTANGRLTAVKKGSTVLTVQYGGQTVFTQPVEVQVPLLGLSANRPAMTLAIGATASSFAAPVPSLASTSAISYSSADPAVASVASNGTIKGLALGHTTVTARSGSYSADCAIQVVGAYPTLKAGSSGELVRQLQQRLADLGYLAGPVDGIYGPKTEFGVSSFQKKLDLPLSGKADHSLQMTLKSEAAPAAAALQAAGTLRRGDSGEAVFVLQQRLYELNFLKTKPDGQFLEHTQQAAAALQMLNGQTLTEWVGPETIALLYSRTVKAGKTTLLLGDSGYEVLILQTRLQTLQYYAGPLDSQFSTAVDTAVKAFQAACSLTADGEAGPLTQGRLYASDAPLRPQPAVVTPEAAIPPAPEPAVPSVLNQGSQGAAVLALEQRLVALGYHYEVANSSYDGLTVQSVKSFQHRAGLAQTGIADLQTQNRLAALTAPRSATSFRRGSRGDAVYRIQLRLNQLGFNCGKADGSFGSITTAAAMAYQRKAGLVADGIIGSRTLAVLFSGSAAASPPAALSVQTPVTLSPIQAPVSSSMTTIRYGSRGEGVSRLQQRLNQLGYSCGSVDGSCGQMTIAAIKAFQRRAGLSADGIAGSRTLTALYAASAPRAR